MQDGVLGATENAVFVLTALIPNGDQFRCKGLTMEHDQTFQLVLLAGIALVLPFALYYRLRSLATGEKLDRRQEGRLILWTLRPIGIVGMLSFNAFLIDPSWMRWSSVPLPVELRWGGVGIGVFAGGLLIWTFHNLGKNLTDTVVTRKAHSLVTTGPYRWVRHPFYVCVAMSMLANSLATANWFLLLTSAIALSLLFIRTRIEEEKLLARFGDDYRAYMQRTGRFWPRISQR